jgi:hypothetical protein
MHPSSEISRLDGFRAEESLLSFPPRHSATVERTMPAPSDDATTVRPPSRF